MRTLIYARYSSDLQNNRSIEDQIRICRERAEIEGWEIVEIFTDYAISGAAGIGESQRPGLNAMLARVNNGGIDQVLAETTSRIARHQGDAYAIRERLNYASVRLFTLADGEIDDIKGWVKGFLDAQQRKDLAFNIKRAQKGVVAEGRAPAGLAYGYKRANRFDDRGNVIRGLRTVEPEQAAIVQRIFAEYAGGSTARDIALRLNAEAVPGPTGGTWRVSTITGDRQRQNGMLQNRLYAGMIVHNRTRKVIDPDSRRVRVRPNPESDWISEPVPALRIIDEATWQAVCERRNSIAHVPMRMQRKPKRLLSGLAVCGVCGGGWIVVTPRKTGCGRERDGGGCSNNRMITVDRLEARVLHGLQEKMLDPELVAIFVAEYHREAQAAASERKADRSKLERRLAEATRKVDRLVAAIASGAGEFAEVRAVLTKARADRDEATEALQEIEADNVVALHPSILDDYRRQMGDLTTALSTDPDLRAEAVPIVRGLIERVTVTPSEGPKGVDIEVTGKLANILSLAAGRAVRAPGMFLLERAKGIEPS